MWNDSFLLVISDVRDGKFYRLLQEKKNTAWDLVLKTPAIFRDRLLQLSNHLYQDKGTLKVNICICLLSEMVLLSDSLYSDSIVNLRKDEEFAASNKNQTVADAKILQ